MLPERTLCTLPSRFLPVSSCAGSPSGLTANRMPVSKDPGRSSYNGYLFPSACAKKPSASDQLQNSFIVCPTMENTTTGFVARRVVIPAVHATISGIGSQLQLSNLGAVTTSERIHGLLCFSRPSHLCPNSDADLPIPVIIWRLHPATNPEK